MDSVVTIEVAQAKADVVPVLGDVGRRTPHIPVHANIIQGVRTTQPAKDKMQGVNSNLETRKYQDALFYKHEGSILEEAIVKDT